MKSKIDSTVAKFNMISPGETVLIALSGGADSVMLAHYLLSIRDEFGIILKAAHIEHGIRGEESLRDCEFVKAFCAENDIFCTAVSINAPEEAAACKMGVEEYSRKRRYEIFEEIPCDKIATAHNLSDNVETVIFRLARGTALQGMCGIPAVRGKIIRPLIELSSSEIRNYLNENNIPYCIDKSNFENCYSRNLIRNEIIPLLSRLNPDVQTAISRFIGAANIDEGFIYERAVTLYHECCSGNILFKEKISDYSQAEIKRVISLFLEGNNISVSEQNINNVFKLLSCSSRAQLSDFAIAASDKKTVRIVKKTDNREFTAEKSVFFIDDFLNICEFDNKKFDFFCDCDKIKGGVTVRCRQPGDEIRPVGRNCTKTLKKLFNELMIPAENRMSIPVIADNKGVIGVCGYCVDERVSVSDKTERVLAVSIRMEDKF